MARPKGIPLTPEHNAKLQAASRAAHKGIPLSAEWKKKISETVKMKWAAMTRQERADMMGLRGEKHPFWITDRSKLKVTRNGIDQTLLTHWRIAVFERDDYVCQSCGKRGGKLNADHIKPVKLFPELALDLSNGRTLCFTCHKKTSTFCGRVRKMTRESFT